MLVADKPTVSFIQFTRLACRAKIQLDIHHFSMPYFECQRIVHDGLLRGNCVLAETFPRVPRLQPGIDCLEASQEDIPSLLDWLLASSEGPRKREEVRHASRDHAMKNFHIGRTLAEFFSVRS